MTTLKDLRRKVALTQAELAGKCGLRQATISSIENGRSKPHPSTLSALAAALKTNIERVETALRPMAPNPISTSMTEPNPTSPTSAAPHMGSYSANVLPEAQAPKIVAIHPVAHDPEAFDPEQLGELARNWTNAQRATDKHAQQWNEAMEFLDPILKKHPGFLKARVLMRTAELEAGLKIPLSDRIPPPQSYIAKAAKKLGQGQAEEALQILEEKVFVYLPTHLKANMVLHQAAIALGLKATARFALEFAATHNPDAKEAFTTLADYYSSIGELEEACMALKRITTIDPSDVSARTAYKNMVASASMQDGTIAEKNHDQRIDLERRAKRALTEEQKRGEIEELVAVYRQPEDNGDATPEAKEGLRRASQHARELGEKHPADLERALEIQHLLVEAYPNDPVLIAGIDELSVALAEQRLCAAEEQQAQSPEVEALREALAETSLEAAQRAILANPTSGELQLSLGKAFIAVGKFREAVKPLQKAKKDPRSGNDIAAMSLLADCFKAGGLLELARSELDNAITSLERRGDRDTDQQWKTVKYQIAQLLAESGEDAESKRIFAEIYAKDSDFKDVEKRVWESA